MTDQVRSVARSTWRREVALAQAQGWTQFDLLGVIDEIGREPEFRVVVRLRRVNLPRDGLRLQTRVPRDDPSLASLVEVFAGAGWHEREAADFFGVRFIGGNSEPLLLRPEYSGFPLRKDEVLAARAGRAWPGAKEPGDEAAAGRRRMVPAGVPDPVVFGERDGDPPTPDEVVASASGGRVRRRR